MGAEVSRITAEHEGAIVGPGRVTVMVPSYNYAQYLAACVESAATQPEADVVIVDNGSTDESPGIGARLAEHHANVRFVRYEDNDGMIASFNRCRDEVRGDFALLLPADDLLAPGSLGRAVALMDAHPQVGLMYGNAIDFSSPAELHLDEFATGAGTPVVHDGGAWVERLCRTGHNPIRTPEAMWRASVFAAAGPYEPDCRHTSDLNLWLRLAARADVCYLRGAVQAMFRQHGANAGNAFPHNSLGDLEQRWTAFERFFERLGDDRADRGGRSRRDINWPARPGTRPAGSSWARRGARSTNCWPSPIVWIPTVRAPPSAPGGVCAASSGPRRRGGSPASRRVL